MRDKYGFRGLEQMRKDYSRVRGNSHLTEGLVFKRFPLETSSKYYEA